MPEGRILNLEQVIKDNPLGDELTKWTYLVEGANMTINVVQAPAANTPHIHHDHDEMVYVLKGKGKFQLGDKIYPVKAGDVAFIPVGTLHTPIIDSYIAVLSVYSPHFDPQNPDRDFINP